MSVLTSPKQATLDLVDRLSDDVSFEDIIYELYVLEKIQRGMNDAAAGRVISHDDGVTLPSAKVSFQQGWHEARADETRAIADLWDGIDTE